MPLVMRADADDLDAIRRATGANEKIGRQAIKTALRKTMRWAATRLRPKVAKATGVKQKVLRGRFKIRHPKGSGMSAAIWIGTDPVGVINLRPRQTKTGVRAGGRVYPGAFIATGKHGNRQVFSRLGKARLPIGSEKIHIHSEVMAAVRGETFAGVEEYFLRTFRHELEWRLQRAA